MCISICKLYSVLLPLMYQDENYKDSALITACKSIFQKDLVMILHSLGRLLVRSEDIVVLMRLPKSL